MVPLFSKFNKSHACMYFIPGASREWICSLGPSWGQCAGWLGRVSWPCWTPCRSGGTSSRGRTSPLPPGGCACSVGVTKQRRERGRERGGGGREISYTSVGVSSVCRFCVGSGVGGGDSSEERKAFWSRPRFDQQSRMVQVRYRTKGLSGSPAAHLDTSGEAFRSCSRSTWFGFSLSSCLLRLFLQWWWPWRR